MLYYSQPFSILLVIEYLGIQHACLIQVEGTLTDIYNFVDFYHEQMIAGALTIDHPNSRKILHVKSLHDKETY